MILQWSKRKTKQTYNTVDATNNSSPEHARTYCSQKILNMFNMFCHIWHLIEHLFNWHQAIKHSWRILRLVHRCSHKPPFHRIFPITPLSSQMFPYICQYLSCVPILNPTLSRIFQDFRWFSMTSPVLNGHFWWLHSPTAAAACGSRPWRDPSRSDRVPCRYRSPPSRRPQRSAVAKKGNCRCRRV